MSLSEQEARSLQRARDFLLDLTSGREKRIPSVTRKRAADIVKHYPLAVEHRWLEHEMGEQHLRRQLREANRDRVRSQALIVHVIVALQRARPLIGDFEWERLLDEAGLEVNPGPGYVIHAKHGPTD